MKKKKWKNDDFSLASLLQSSFLVSSPSIAQKRVWCLFCDILPSGVVKQMFFFFFELLLHLPCLCRLEQTGIPNHGSPFQSTYTHFSTVLLRNQQGSKTDFFTFSLNPAQCWASVEEFRWLHEMTRLDNLSIIWQNLSENRCLIHSWWWSGCDQCFSLIKY